MNQLPIEFNLYYPTLDHLAAFANLSAFVSICICLLIIYIKTISTFRKSPVKAYVIALIVINPFGALAVALGETFDFCEELILPLFVTAPLAVLYALSFYLQ